MFKSKGIYNLTICMIVLFGGVVLSYQLTNTVIKISLLRVSYSPFFNFATFYKIFCTNLFVSILISIFGFFTGGLLCLSILFWNGMIIGEMIKTYMTEGSSFPFFIYHGIFEIAAFLGFGVIGMKGLDFFCEFISL